MERALSNVPPRGMELWFMQPWAAAADGRAALEPMLSRNYRAFNSPVRPGRGAQSSHLGTVPPGQGSAPSRGCQVASEDLARSSGFFFFFNFKDTVHWLDTYTVRKTIWMEEGTQSAFM